VIAAFGMYDEAPAQQAANDRLWDGVRARLAEAGIAAPEALARGAQAFWPAWTAPDLVLAQTCGLPFRARLYPRVTLIGVADHGLEGCAPGTYRSALIVRADDPRDSLAAYDGARFALNEALSQSGYAAPLAAAAVAGIRLFPGLVTGRHSASVAAVAEGRAPLAAVDALTWRNLQRWGEPAHLRAVRVLGWTDPTPALPYIAAPGADAAQLRAALAGAIADLSEADRATLSLQGLLDRPAEAWLAVPTPPPPAHFGATA
jgi:ABC-type phosphate/phosphonate transport system substrate-binding protein